MNVKEINQKYTKIISLILNCNESDIKIEYRAKEKYDWIPFNIGDYVKSDFCLGDYRVLHQNNVISSWKLYELPHCCAYMVSCNVCVNEPFSNKGIGTQLNTYRQEVGRALGYSAILCTDLEMNTKQRKILKKNGWKDLHKIVNKRTNNTIFLSVINI